MAGPGSTLLHYSLRGLLLAAVLIPAATTWGQGAREDLGLTPAEQRWLDEHGDTIRLAAYANYPPGQFLDEHGRHAGLAADYQHRLEELLGIQFVEVASHNWDAVLEQSRNRELDVLALAMETPDRLAYLSFTEPYLVLPATILAREGTSDLTVADLEGMKVSVPSGYAVHDFLVDEHPELTLDPVPDTRTGLRKLSVGMTDVLVSDLMAASHYIEEEGITNLRVVGETTFIYRMGFAARSDWPELVSILDKALARIDAEERHAIAERWISLARENVVSRRRFLTVLLTSVGIAAVLLAGIFVWNRMLQGRVDLRTRQLKDELSERRRTAKALAASEERVRRIIDTALEGVITMDAEGLITGWSRQATSDFGWAPEEAIGRDLADLIVPPQHKRGHTEGLARYRATGKAHVLNRRIELTAIHRDGHEFPIELSIAPIRRGNDVEFSAFVRDITDRKQAEAELIRHRHHLEEMVEERTRELQEAKEVADIANRAKSDFLANMSHEIRTPMTAILGYAAILRELGDLERAPVERIEALDTISRNGDHLLALINDILDLSKLEAGGMTVERIPCSPVEIARDVLDLMQLRARERSLALDLGNAGPVPATIRTDPTRLRQILVNLVGNAIKFTDRGGVTMTLRLDGERLAFDVTDTGIGMDAEQRAAVFEPFTQADTSTSRRYGGTGLGLSISRRFATLLGGSIEVRSESGVGSTFTAFVDADTPDGVAMLSDISEHVLERAAPDNGRPEAPASLRGRHVLLAEDTPDNQRLIRYHLEKAGMHVVIATNGRAVVEAAAHAVKNGHRFDVVLMDIQMPEMDGYAAAAALRRDGYTGPIIALTASTMSGDRDRALRSGMTDHVAKPIVPGSLIGAIAAGLNVSEAAARPDFPAAPAPAGTPVLDRDAMHVRFGSRELLGEVVDLFLDESAEAMVAMRQAAADGALADVERCAHRLRGCAGNFGAAAVTEAATRIEQIAGDGGDTDLGPAVAALDHDVAALRDALAELRASL